MYNTGIKACDELKELHIQGNITPRIWYKTIVKDGLKKTKPHFLAIDILSDIVYWYRPTAVRDEQTSEILGYKKKFRGELLQRSYSDIAESFYGAYSKDTIKEAIVFLEKLHVIKRVFKNQIINGMCVNNIMYIDLNVSRLRELTYPEADTSQTGGNAEMTDNKTSPEMSDKEGISTPVEISTEGRGKSSQGGGEITTSAAGKSLRTNTKNTNEISSGISPSILLSWQSADTEDSFQNDGMREEDLADEVRLEIKRNHSIPYWYYKDRNRMTHAIKVITDWKQRVSDPARFDSSLEYECYKLIVDCLIEMACEDLPKKYHGSYVANGTKVIEKINEYIDKDAFFYGCIEDAIKDYKVAAKKTKIVTTKDYLKSILWTSLCTHNLNFESLFARTNYGIPTLKTIETEV